MEWLKRLFGHQKPIHDRVINEYAGQKKKSIFWQRILIMTACGIGGLLLLRVIFGIAAFGWNTLINIFLLTKTANYHPITGGYVWHVFAGCMAGQFFLGFLFLLGFGLGFLVSRRFLDAKKEADDTEHLIDHKDATRLARPEVLPERYDVVPDAGAHHNVDFAAIVSHMMLDNQGVKSIEMPVRDKNGDLKVDEDGNVEYRKVSMFDKKFGKELYDANDITQSTMDSGRKTEQWFNPKKLKYNPKGKSFEKRHRKYKTVAELINKTWTIPDYESTRPAGVYVVDTSNSNTMLIAETRAGKGQSIIRPTLDAWSRSNILTNMLVNDPKGENATMMYYPLVKRGYQVVIFNLMNSERTNIYNPLGLAIQATRKGDMNTTSTEMTSIGNVFFPIDKGQEKFWQQSAQYMFKEVALALVDYYREEEQEIRQLAFEEHWTSARLDHKLDELWGHVTLYNVYQMVTQLASHTTRDWKIASVGAPDEPEDKTKEIPKDEAIDYLTLFFRATEQLPINSLREAALNNFHVLSSMAKSENTLASVEGIALATLADFSDSTIVNLTSGKPSDDFDMLGMGFPRRFEVQLHPAFIKKLSLTNIKYRWRAYHDPKLKRMYKDSEYVQSLNSDGWLTYLIKPVFKSKVTYVLLELIDEKSDMVVRRLVFKFRKGFKRTPDGKAYTIDAVTHKRIIDGGTLTPMLKDAQGRYTIDGSYDRRTTITVQEANIAGETANNKLLDPELLDAEAAKQRLEQHEVSIFRQIQIHYNERPKAVFVVAPPQKQAYAQTMLIMLDQVFNQQVSYANTMTSDQSPFYGTKYLLDEVGNLRANGSGIPDLITKESIGLSDKQQYTLVVQAIQQISELYSKDIMDIIESNTKNIQFLNSLNEGMRNRVSKLSGVQYVVHKTGDNFTRDVSRVAGRTEAKISTSRRTEKENVIKPDDLLGLKKGEMYVVGTNKQEPIFSGYPTTMPYSYALHSWKRYPHKSGADPKKDKYTVSSLPVENGGRAFDRIGNTPDFFNMVTKRVKQARLANVMRERYKKIYGEAVYGHTMTDDEFHHESADEVADIIMRGINTTLQRDAQARMTTTGKHVSGYEAMQVEATQEGKAAKAAAGTNDEMLQAKKETEEKGAKYTDPIYFDSQISKKDLEENKDFQAAVDETLTAVAKNNGGLIGKLRQKGDVYTFEDDLQTPVASITKVDKTEQIHAEKAFYDALWTTTDWAELLGRNVYSTLVASAKDWSVLKNDEGNRDEERAA